MCFIAAELIPTGAAVALGISSAGLSMEVFVSEVGVTGLSVEFLTGWIWAFWAAAGVKKAGSFLSVNSEVNLELISFAPAVKGNLIEGRGDSAPAVSEGVCCGAAGTEAEYA